MKKFILSLLLGLSVGLSGLYASGLKAGSYDFFRATESISACTNIQIATSSIYLYGYTVSSGNYSSTFQYRNSSSPSTSGGIHGTAEKNNVIASTSVVYTISPTDHGTFVYIGDYLSEGFNITRTGNAHLRIFWNWINFVPAGQENKGFRR